LGNSGALLPTHRLGVQASDTGHLGSSLVKACRALAFSICHTCKKLGPLALLFSDNSSLCMMA
jgi:hypothetical protein